MPLDSGLIDGRGTREEGGGEKGSWDQERAQGTVSSNTKALTLLTDLLLTKLHNHTSLLTCYANYIILLN